MISSSTSSSRATDNIRTSTPPMTLATYLSQSPSARLGLLGLSILTLVALALWSGSQGAYPISSWRLISGQLSGEDWQVFQHIRLPRMLLSLFIGAGLGLSGAVLQALLRNPLADPQIIGVSSGAAVAVGICMLLGPRVYEFVGLYTLPAAAFAGGTLICSLMLLAAQGRRGFDPGQLILMGVAFNAIAGAAIGMIQYLSDDQQLRSFAFWMLGSLSGAFWWQVYFMAAITLPGVLLTWHYRRGLDLLALGETEAEYAGINTARLKWQLVIAVALMVGVSVAFSGIIAFVGLIVPHLVRLLFGASQRLVIPMSAVFGAAFLLIADTLARTLVTPQELPIGVITSLIGGPFFLWLLIRRQSGMKL